MCRLEIIIHRPNSFSYDRKAMKRRLRLVDVIKKFLLGQTVYTTAYRDGLLQNVIYPLNILINIFSHTATMSFRAL